MKIMEMEIVVSLLIFVLGVAVLSVIHHCVVARVFRRGYENRENEVPGRISNEDLKNLPSFNYTAKETQESISSDCAVCLEMFSDGDECRLLPNCNHSFHAQCIDSWLLKTAICPICRTRVNPPKIAEIFSQPNGISVAVEVGLT